MMKIWTAIMKSGLIILFLFVFLGQLIAQCNSWEAHPDGAEAAKEQHVIYRRSFENKNYTEAFPVWEGLFKYVTTPKEAKSRHLKDGIIMYQAFAKEEKDKKKKTDLLDKMNALYDQIAVCLGEKSSDRAWQGYRIYSARGNSEKAIEAFEKAIELGKNETHNMVLVPISQLTIWLFQKKHPKFTVEYMRKLYDTLKDIADYNIQNNQKDSEKYKTKWEKVKNEFRKIGDDIWGCDFHVSEWQPKFERDKMNMEQNKEILKVLKKKCGEGNELYESVLAIYAPWKQRVDDSIAEANFKELCNLKKGEFQEKKSFKARKNNAIEKADSLKNEAFSWYEKSLNDPLDESCETTNEAKGELAYRLADNYYRLGAYSKARSLCNQAAQLKPNWGDPFMLIGTMYASSGKRCSGGKGTGWDAQTVAWAAMDMWSKAKRIDPSVASEASKKIARYKKYLPTKGDIFQRGLKENSSYKIGCWIGVTTTIRAGGEE
ncbi:MAG: tetratricopeptide repeat protein [Saprospiraceae bacterium]|nr:tetratricopeptide repeat protein [Saprospiraceae bacterium]